MNMKSTYPEIPTARVVVGLLCAVLAAGTVSAGEPETREWTMSSFNDFRQGSLVDGGANTYITADGHVRLINLWDLNGDGRFDIPVTCPQDYTESPDLFIYWSRGDGFSPDHRTALPTQGSLAGASADLDKNGYLDLIVCNRFDGEKNNLDSYIYWGGKEGFSEARRSGLPTEAAEDVAVADLDSDGYPDLVFANHGSDYHMQADNRQRSFVYFGGEGGYGPSRKLELKTVAATGVELADVNGDGHTDILFSMEGNARDDGGAIISYNDGKGGFSEKQSLHLAGMASSDLAVANLNGDGYPDIVLANRCIIKEKPYPGVRSIIETSDVNSYIYWGDEKGYSIVNRAELPSPGASSVAVADLNRNGLADIVFACGQKASFVYWNSREGFSATNRTELETNAAMGCAAADLNEDGYPDLVIANDQLDESYNTDSHIYWGGEDGFSPQRRSGLPTLGAAGVVLSDLDGDGRIDIAFMNKKEGFVKPRELYVYQGDEQGRFRVDRRWASAGRTDDSYVTADLNADGYSDLLFFAADARIHWGGGNGPSEENISKLEVPHRGNTAAVADLNRDGFWIWLWPRPARCLRCTVTPMDSIRPGWRYWTTPLARRTTGIFRWPISTETDGWTWWSPCPIKTDCWCAGTRHPVSRRPANPSWKRTTRAVYG